LTPLSKKQDVLDVVLDDLSGLIWLSLETRAIALYLSRAIGDFVPQNRGEAVNSNAPHPYLDVGMQRHDVMAPGLLPRDAYIAHNATDASSGGEYAHALAPRFVELIEELFVIFDESHLTFPTSIFL
jgi:hypothetical protein